MKPIFQTRLGKVDGNCFAACLCSIFEIDDIDSIPEFGKRSDWYDQFSNWMMTNYQLKPLDIDIKAIDGADWIPPGYYIINGISINGIWHSTVGYQGKVIHDPLPEKPCIYKPETFEIRSVTVFVATV